MLRRSATVATENRGERCVPQIRTVAQLTVNEARGIDGIRVKQKVLESVFRPERKHTPRFGSDGYQRQQHHGRLITDVISRGVWGESISMAPHTKPPPNQLGIRRSAVSSLGWVRDFYCSGNTYVTNIITKADLRPKLSVSNEEVIFI